ncbi:MAG: hypothetical protein HY075_07390, partial [Deltaproteobacteria bacterium]|nr:hypothetical protein [Deltaproteobacteria bacterium]
MIRFKLMLAIGLLGSALLGFAGCGGFGEGSTEFDSDLSYYYSFVEICGPVVKDGKALPAGMDVTLQFKAVIGEEKPDKQPKTFFKDTKMGADGRACATID